VNAPSESWLTKPAREIAAAVASRAVSHETPANEALARYQSTHTGATNLNAVIWTDAESSRDDARRVGLALDGDTAGASVRQLAGVPFVAKDNIATLDLLTTCGSRILHGYRSPYEATAVERLRASGAILVGKSNCDEFAMGSSTEHSAYGPCLNPLDHSRVPGGSSGGSAAAVAAGIVSIALGSETGGSVRQPASFCGIVGVKPTYGRVSRYGLVAFASSLDQIGVFGRTVDDSALALRAIAGFDPRDATASDVAVPEYDKASQQDVSGLVIGRPVEYFPDSLDPDVRSSCDRALEVLHSQGAEIRDVSLPHTKFAIPVYYIIAPAEASSNLARFDGVRYGLRLEGDGLRGMYEATRSGGFGAEVTRRILLGTYVLSAGYYDAYYRQAQRVRALIARDFRNVFESGVNALFTPTAPSVAFEFGSRSDPYEMYLSDIFTVTANLAGVPAMSVPVGHVTGLPVGGQIIASHFDEQTMFRVAFALEKGLGKEAHR
jgi:aspartyl-tRNA(Asn)/glutamyl-tRNA(Gln) amidotransferase subunit A